MKEKIRYSIIIPHHDIPQLLERCLKSMPWDRNDIQVIVVDDASSEENVASVKVLENKYPKAEFSYNDIKGKGAGYARNMGLDKAKGEYVMFVDADDFFNPCIRDILEDYKDKDYDIVYFDANSVDTDTYEPTKRNMELSLMVDDYVKGKEKAEMLLRYSFGEPWCKIVRRSVIVDCGIRFDETIIHNDTTYSYLVGHHCKTMAVDSRKGYCVTDRQGSVSKRKSLDRLLIRTAVFARANLFYRANGIPFFEERGMRPMIMFFLKGKFNESNACYKTMRECGMSRSLIAWELLLYPYHALKKGIFIYKSANMKQEKVENENVNVNLTGGGKPQIISFVPTPYEYRRACA